LEDSSLGLVALAETSGVALVAVEDTIKALQDGARAYLGRFPTLIRVGITGSSGKTTTKEIAAGMIVKEKRVVMNPGNLNSETGLPLAVFNVRSEHEVGIFELGMDHKGEIAALARILKPHIALITNIGTAHIGMIGSQRAIVEEKRAIFGEFTGTEMALIPADSPWREVLAGGVWGRALFYGSANLEEFGKVKSLGIEGSEVTWEGVRIRFGLPGRHNLRDALAASAIARAVPVSDEAIRQGLASVQPLFGRSEIVRGLVTVIRDCYNSNPDSAKAALDFCDSLDWPGRKLYVIGSMLELGPESAAAHRELGQRIAASQADQVFFFGAETLAATESLAGGKIPFYYTDNMDELYRAVSERLSGGDLILLKGSRGCALERLDGLFGGLH
jgi:UDP-N-acetylmuramoyl-tripeptide--D-alanyl-D-alanine ligase